MIELTDRYVAKLLLRKGIEPTKKAIAQKRRQLQLLRSSRSNQVPDHYVRKLMGAAKGTVSQARIDRYRRKYLNKKENVKQSKDKQIGDWYIKRCMGTRHATKDEIQAHREKLLAKRAKQALVHKDYLSASDAAVYLGLTDEQFLSLNITSVTLYKMSELMNVVR